MRKLTLKINFSIVLYLSALIFCLPLFCKESNPLIINSAVDILDCACSSFNNPLKGLNNFTVLATNTPTESELLIEELEKIGRVKKFSFKDAKGINFEGMGTGARLMLILTPLSVIGETKSEIIRISLTLSTSVEVLKTKNHIDSYIWATNIFSTNDSKNEAIKNAVKQFATYYKEANPNQTQPIFYVYY